MTSPYGRIRRHPSSLVGTPRKTNDLSEASGQCHSRLLPSAATAARN